MTMKTRGERISHISSDRRVSLERNLSASEGFAIDGIWETVVMINSFCLIFSPPTQGGKENGCNDDHDDRQYN
jgi:hypothetical protein